MIKRLLPGDLHFDWKVVTITIVSTLLLMTDSYFALTQRWIEYPWWKLVDRTILFLIAPILIICFVFRDSPKDYGFTLGDWKAGILITLGAIVLIAPVIWLVGRSQSMTEYYDGMMKYLPWNTFLDLFGWEFFFRGWLLFGYARKFGSEALWLQAVPFALAHVGKPAVETFSTIFGGFAFGWVAWRTGSFLYPFLIHWFVFSFTILVAVGLLG